MHEAVQFLVGSIPVFAFVILMIAYRLRSLRERRLIAQANADQAKCVSMSSREGLLEQRVRVLERIAVDRGADLSAEIGELQAPESI